MKHVDRCHILASLTLAVVAGLVSCIDEVELLDEDAAFDEGDVELRAFSTESEPNNTTGSSGVKSVVLSQDAFGELSAADTDDYWRLQLQAPTYVNLFLGEIPSGSDYDLYLLKDGATVWSGVNSGNQSEMVLRKYLDAGTYYLRVKSYTNPQAGKKYRLRAASPLSRAGEWVDVQMPYCQAINGKWDATCNQTCTRPSKPEWDIFRSDCSGLISWAYNLPDDKGGLNTTELPSRFSAIALTNLRPGDILVTQGHAFMFEAWVDKAARRARVVEEPTCGLVASRRTVEFLTLNASNQTSKISGDSRTYTARRFVP